MSFLHSIAIGLNDMEFPEASEKQKPKLFALLRQSAPGEGGFDCGSKLSTPPPKLTSLGTFLFQESAPPEAPHKDTEKSSFEAIFFGFRVKGGRVLCTTKPGTQRLRFLDSAALEMTWDMQTPIYRSIVPCFSKGKPSASGRWLIQFGNSYTAGRREKPTPLHKAIITEIEVKSMRLSVKVHSF